ncbi:MAG TPA: ribosomal-processing cysteine protease Prp [Bacillota bacterium]|nr:ribosomal-processing cysteine protease Prp [Bacillota bacterium]
MIQVAISRSNKKITAFEISGHADSGPYGYDLVCAGVSAVSFGVINAIHELCGVELVIEEGREGGYLYAEIPTTLPEIQKDNIQILLQGMLISLQTIEREYEKFLKIQQ